MSDTVQQIKDRLTIVDVVQPYVKLTRAGKYWKGLSPFSKEKTPSFFVTPDRGLYHCFSSGKGGDMFTFVQEMEGVDFKGALKILAEKAGVEIRAEAPGVRDEREQVYAALDAARSFFESVLQQRTDVQGYLEKRGVDGGLARNWSVGYAPKEWHALKDALVNAGFSEKVIELAGLIKKEEGRVYDRFRGRIMFPIRDASGRVIGFSGRIFEDDTAHPQAKYINSPESPVFDKSRALYGIHEAKNGIRELGFSMLVEGQVDLLMVHKLGFKNAVATSGTAFTPAHAEILMRYSPNILLAYDGDKAGVAAAGRAAAIALPRGMNVKIVALPPGEDPADLIHKDPAAFKDAVKHAVPVVDFFLTHLKGTARDARTYGLEVGRTVLPFVAMIENKLDQSHFVGRVAEALHTTHETVMAELRKLPPPGTVGASASANPFSSIDQGEQLLYGVLRTWEAAGNPLAARVEAILVKNFGLERLTELRASPQHEEEAALILASENFFVLHPAESVQVQILGDLERDSERRARRATYAETERLLKAAAASGNKPEEERLLVELARLAKGLEN